MIAYAGLAAPLAGGCGDAVSARDSTYQRLQSQVFDVSCALSSCHFGDRPAAELALEPGASHGALVGRAPVNPAANAAGWSLVQPEEPDRSFLLAKLDGMLEPGMGAPMPKSAGLLDEGTIEIVRAWIAEGAPIDGRVAGDDGRDLAAGAGAGGEVRLAPPERGVQLDVSARALPPGKEETLCHFLKLPSDEELDVRRIQVAVSGGSHHIHLYRAYRPDLDLPDGFEECNNAVDFDRWELLAVTQLPYLDWQLPEGVAIALRAGEQLLMQTHFVNVGFLETSGDGRVLMNLHEAEPGSVTMHAASFFGQDKDVHVPARSEITASTACQFPKPVTLIAQTGHYHYRGRRFSTYRWSEAGRGEQLYAFEGYDEPAFLEHGEDAPTFAAGEGLEFECYWENDSDRTFEFGPFTDEDEHCNLFAFYYPAETTDEAMTCVKDEGESVTTVRRTDAIQ